MSIRTMTLVFVLLVLPLGSGCQRESPPPAGQAMTRNMDRIDAMTRQMGHVEDTAPDTIHHTVMRDRLLTALLMGYAVQQRCGVTPPLTRSLEISLWLTQKYAGVDVLMKSMLVDLESTAEAYCKNNG